MNNNSNTTTTTTIAAVVYSPRVVITHIYIIFLNPPFCLAGRLYNTARPVPGRMY